MKQPIRFIHRNLVFGETLNDAWAVYRLPTRSYFGLSTAGKREMLSLIASCAYSLEADFSILRVARPWSVDNYALGVEAGADVRHAHTRQLTDYVEGHRRKLAGSGAHLPEVYLSVRLSGREPGKQNTRPPLLGALRSAVGLDDPRGIGAKRLEALAVEQEATFDRILDYLECEPAATHELQWLVRRAFSRSLADPVVEERFLPQALVVEAPEEEGGLRYRPLEADLMRLCDNPIEVAPRGLRIETEQGDSHQAFLCLGALPETVRFPGRQAELLFAPLENLDFPVDAAFSARYIPNEAGVRLIRRRIVTADQIFDEESHGDHGPSSSAATRPALARELEDYLTGGDHPPLLRAGVSFCVSAGSEEELEDRVASVRRELGAIGLHRPLGEQLPLFCTHLPGQPSRVADYEDYFTVEQLGAMVPIATNAVGAETGPYVGHTLSGSRHPVLFDPTEASRTSRAPATLFAGTLGSGKTLAMELVMYQAFLAGSTICDIDPKGDHALERLPGVAEHMEVIELSPEPHFAGLLDPLRIAPEQTREDLACQFLLSILPDPVPAGWQTEIRLAVKSAAAAATSCCGDVVSLLEAGGEDAREAARALRIHAGTGLARLGFATPDSRPAQEAGTKQVTSLRIRNLTLPLPGITRAEMQEEERIGQALLRLLAVYALHLTSADPRRHSVLGFDEAWVLLSDVAGRSLVDRISRLGRSQNITPLLATQVLGDVDQLESLIGAAFCFGVETEREARKALRLLGLDEEDQGLQQRLTSFRAGRCLFRDYSGRVGQMQVDLVDRELLEALDTRPRATRQNGSGPDLDPSDLDALEDRIG